MIAALLLWVSTPVWGAEWIASAGTAGVARVGAIGGSTVGAQVQAGLGLPVAPRVVVEATGALGAAAGAGFLGDAGVGVRWYLGEPWTYDVGLSLVGGAGMGWRAGPASTASIGAAVDLPRRHTVVPWAQVRFVAETASGLEQSGASSVLVSIGISRVSPRLVAPSIDPPEALVWLPHPICDWVPAEEAADRLAEITAAERFEVVAENHAPQWVEGPPPRTLSLVEVPPQGSVIVVARPGDQVRIGADGVALSSGGTAVVNSLEGEITVTVVGGGRSHEVLTGVVDGYATWVRAPDPPSVLIRFPAGSAELSDAALATLDGLVRDAGDWSFALAGSHSPEGEDESNEQLSQNRAQAVRDAMIRAGMPPERLSFDRSFVPTAATRLADQRSCLITPLTPLEAP